MNVPNGPSDESGAGPAPESFVADFSEGLETGLYLALLELIDEGLIITGDETILDVNSAACRLLERDYREIAGKPLSTLFPSEKAFLQARERLFIQGEMRGSLQVALPGGRLRSMRFVAAARLRPGIHALILSPDLLAEAYTATTAASAPVADPLWPRLAAALEQPVIVVDEAGRTVAANAAAVQTLNLKRSKLVGQPLTSLITIEWPQQGKPPLARLSGQGFADCQARVLAGPKPQWRVLILPPAAATSPPADSEKKPEWPQRDFLERTFNDSPLPTFLCEGADLRIFAVNEAAVRLYGYSRAELCGLSIQALRCAGNDDQPLREHNLWRHRSRDGRRFEVEILAYPINPPGHPGAVALMHDLPERPLLGGRVYLPADVASAAAQAIDRQQLLVHFQPLIDIRDGSIRSGEALLRWQHPEIGLLPFGRFMKIAQDDGLMARMGDWVMQTACRHAAQWSEVNHHPPGLTVNLAGEQIAAGTLVGRVKKALGDSGLEAHRLELDLHHSVFNQDNALLKTTLSILNSHGIRLAIDDFGEGSFSWAYLQEYPLSAIKLAAALTQPQREGPRNENMIEAMAAIAKAFGLALVARGIDAREQQNFMSAYGCDLQQGPLFGPSMSAEDFLILIRRNQGSAAAKLHYRMGR